MATKRVVHTLPVQVRLSSGATKTWRFRVTSGERTQAQDLAEGKKKARADAKVRAADEGAEILRFEKWKEKTKWRALIPKPDGKYRERIFDKFSEAEDWEKAQQTAETVGINLDLSKKPLGSVAEDWREFAGMKWSAAMTAQVDSFLRVHILPRWGDVPVGQIIQSDVLKWCGSMHRVGAGHVYQVTLPDGSSGERVFRSEAQAKAWQANLKGRVLGSSQPKGLEMSTVRSVCSILERILNLSVADKAISGNPCSGIEWPDDDDDEDGPGRWLERSEVQALALAMREQYQALVLTGAGAGLRFSELAGLRRDRILAPVDLNRAWRIQVDRALVEVDGVLHEKKPKTKHGRREVPIPTGLADVLMDHCDRFDVEESDLVFTSPTGAPLRRGNFSKRELYPASEKALGERIHTHDLRRTFVAQCAGDGIPAEVVKGWAGHGSLRVTMDIYHAVLPSVAAKAVAQLEEANSGVIFRVGWSTDGHQEGDAQAAAS